VIHVAGDRVVPAAAGRFLAAKIPGADYVEVEGDDHFC
jgi:pimeloyl-ACP methyl ester carboxylesterase